jgi:N-acetylglutamate synthase-like GNAT family acetyltransferase
MAARYASPEMQAFMRQVAAGAAAGGDPAALAASMAAGAAPHERDAAPVRAAACRYRRGRASDIPALARLIVAGELPPLFIEEFVEGFVAVEHDGELVGCGGLEIYDDAGVIRSVVVDERGRGQRIGERIADLLMAEAAYAGLSELYLFTMHAHDFWLRLGYVDVPLDVWSAPPCVCWQYQFLAGHPEAAAGVFSMRRSVDAHGRG